MGDAERVRTTCSGIVPTPRHDLEELAPPHLSQSSLYLRARLWAEAQSRVDSTSQRRPRAVDSVVGMIVRTDGTRVTVRDADGREWRCVLRGRLRQELAGATSPVAIGDRVEVDVAGPALGAARKIRPRHSQLMRGAAAATAAPATGRPARRQPGCMRVAPPPPPTPSSPVPLPTASGGCSPA